MKFRKSMRAGFTLVELLIVVIILGILAAIAIPQFTDSTEDAKLSTLSTNLAGLRNSIELYYHQHNSTYPGANKDTDGAASATAGEAQTAFIEQLTKYSAITGVTSDTKDATHKYGPYLKRASLPNNPFNDLTSILCDITTADISTAASSGTAGWKFYTLTGRFLANDGSHDTD